jgi:uncharacterized protein (DUF2141 family)
MKLAILALPLLFACTAAAGEPAAEPVAEPVAAAEPAAAGTIHVRMSGFRSADGQVLIAVFKGESGFPGDPAKAWKKLVARVENGRARVDIAGAAPGDYAISVVHDENANNTLDTSWIGIPKEGIGTSNNAKGRMGPPKYRDAKFSVTEAGASQDITMMYL